MELDKIEEIVLLNHEAVFTTFRRSGAIQMSIVTVGVLLNGVAFTISPGSAKLANLRHNPRCSLLVSRRDWGDYAVLEGLAQILSPDATPVEELRLTLREVYRAASGKNILTGRSSTRPCKRIGVLRLLLCLSTFTTVMLGRQ